MSKKYRLNEKAWKNKDAWKLVNENWTLCHDIVDARDGHKCVICLRERDLQLDHCISRTHKSVFLDTDNLNWLCNKCHTSKSFNTGNVLTKQVDEITRKRIGTKGYNELIRKAQTNCGQWRTLSHQEACNEQLKEELEMAQSIGDLKGWRR